MIYTKEIQVNETVKGVTPTLFRNFILDMVKNLDKNDLEKIHFHLSVDDFKSKEARKIPHIVFSKPFGNSFFLKAFKDDGLILLNKIIKCLDEKIVINGKIFNIMKIKEFSHEIMPKKTEELFTYRTVTPLVFFKGNRRKIYDAIYFKYKDEEQRDVEFKKSVNAMIRANIKNYLCTFIKRKDYKSLDNIDIDWIDFKIIMRNIRNEKIPCVVGEFRTKWELPHLIGSRVGIGFGHIMKNINRDKKITNKKVKAIYSNGSGYSCLLNSTVNNYIRGAKNV